MKLATVRLLHCMQGLEKSRKTLIFEKKEEECSLFLCAHCTLKAADTSENPLFFTIEMPLHSTNIMTKNWQSMGKSALAHVRAPRRAYACYSFFYKDWNNFCIRKTVKSICITVAIATDKAFFCVLDWGSPNQCTCAALLLTVTVRQHWAHLSCHTAKGLVSSATRVNLFTFFPVLSLLPKYEIIYAGYNSKGVFYDILQI